MTKVIALLSFYDESVQMLTELVESLASAGVSGIVAVDGAYAEYPDAQNTTGTDQALAILQTATINGMKANAHIPPGPWEGNELEKREFLFALGHQYADVGEDWFWVVDGDEVITACDDDQMHQTLSTTNRRVAEVVLQEPGGREWDMRMLFKSDPTGIHLGAYHAYYETGDGRVLWASCHQKLQDPAVTVPGCHVLNRPLQRDKQRNLARRQYAERAVLLGLDQAMI